MAPEWSDLVDRALDSDPFVTPEWYLAWWGAFGTGTMRLLAVRKDTRLIGVAPLRISREKLWGVPQDVLELWSNEFSNRAHLVLDEKHASEAAEAIVGAILSREGRWHLARLDPILRQSRNTHAVIRALEARGVTWGIRDSYASPYLALPKTWAELEGTLSTSFRSTVRRVTRRAEKGHEVVISYSGDRAADSDAAFEIDKHTWQYQQGTGIGSGSSTERFYREVADSAARRGWLRMAYLMLDGLPVAFEYNILFKNELYNLKVGYREDEAKLSPGLILRTAVVESSVKTGIVGFDFLGTAEGYKLHWTPEVRRHAEVWIHARGPLSYLVHQLLFRLRPFLERRMPWILSLKRRLRTPEIADD